MRIGIRDALAYFRDGQVSVFHKALGLLAIAYVISPFDLSPDVFPVIGWLDDVGVLALVATYYVGQIRGHRSKAPPTLDAQPIRSS